MTPPLPVIVFFIPQPDQQIPSYFFEDFLVILAKILFPFAGFPRTERGGLTRVDGCLKRFEQSASFYLKWNTCQKMIDDAVQGSNAVMDQIFKVDFHHHRLIQPAKIRGKTPGDVGEFNICIRASQNADLKPRIEIQQRLVVSMMDVILFHLGDVENVRDGYIAWIAIDEVGDEIGASYVFHNVGTSKQMCGGDVTRI